MSALNNLDGKRVKDGRVLHNEQVAPDVYFTVFALFDPNDSRFLLYAEMTVGSCHTWSNGVVSMDNAKVRRDARPGESLPGLDADLVTTSGLRVYQEMGGVYEHKNGSKHRYDHWCAQVPKDELLGYLSK